MLNLVNMNLKKTKGSILTMEIQSVRDVERRLNEGFDRTCEEKENCIKWLTEFMVANQMTLRELDELCYEDSNWVFDQIFQ